MMKPLREALEKLHPGGGMTVFWVSFTTVMLYVAPLLFTLLFEGAVIVSETVNIVRAALAASLFGSFAVLLVVGYQFSQARPSPRQR
jgi:hypothetical protein